MSLTEIEPSTEQLIVKGQTVYFKSSEKIEAFEIGEPVSLIITSPPYWDLKDYGHEREIGKSSYSKYIERMNIIWEKCYDVSKENALLIIIIRARRRRGIFFPIPMDIAKNMKRWKFIDYMIWYSPNAMTQNKVYKNKLYDRKTEMILIFAKNYKYDYTFNKIRVTQKYKYADPRDYKRDPKGRGLPNIIRCPAQKPPKIREKNYHVAAFPDRLIYALVWTFTNKGDRILDPFLGSGTVLKIARYMKRIGIGYEINKRFRKLIEARINEPFEPPAWEELDILHEPSKINPVNTHKPRVPKERRLYDFL